MLCYLPRGALAGSDVGPPYDQRLKGRLVVVVERLESKFQSLPEAGPERQTRFQEDVPGTLLPCATCTRTFLPQSLEKHVRICERAAAKKRKPFDSAKQRIQGTDLAEFLPKQAKKQTRRHYHEERPVRASSFWKQSHDHFLRTIHAARADLDESRPQRQTSGVLSASGPTRANEKGVCRTCNRQFGIKAYDRHVAWCKERMPRAPVDRATNRAKERLEARMKYRAPPLKIRRAAHREKYTTPGSPTAHGNVAKTGGEPSRPSSSSSSSSSSASSHLRPSRGIISSRNRDKPTENSAKQQSPDVERLSRQPSPLVPIKSRTAAARAHDSGTPKNYDPFSLAEQQMNELLSETSDSTTDGPVIVHSRQSLRPLSRSSAFVRYSSQEPTAATTSTDKSISLIAPPTEFDDLVSDFSNDSTETNSLSREIFLKDLVELKEAKNPGDSLELPCQVYEPVRGASTKELSRRVIIDKSRALAGDIGRARKMLAKAVRPTAVNRASSGDGVNEAPKSLSFSNLSLTSLVSSEIDVKRSNSVFDDSMPFFDDNVASHPPLRFPIKDGSISVSSPVHGSSHTLNQQISDEELSSPDSYKPQDRGESSVDSAYSSLNHKHSTDGCSTNDIGAHDNKETSWKINVSRSTGINEATIKRRMSNFCHECGSKFPKMAKFCCECGMKRLIL